MPPGRIIEALDEVKYGHAGLGLRAEAAPVEKLALERREERLTRSTTV